MIKNPASNLGTDKRSDREMRIGIVGAEYRQYQGKPDDLTYRKAMNSSLSEVTVATEGNLIILPSTRTLMQHEKTVRLCSQNEVRRTVRYDKRI